jgi:hypothetical protein
LKPWKFSLPKKWWEDIEHQKEFFDETVKQLKLEDVSQLYLPEISVVEM